MRTTIRLDDQLLSQAKTIAAETNRSLTAVIEESLRHSISLQQRSPKRRRVRLTTVKGRGLQPGVDLDDTAALLDLMEAPRDAPTETRRGVLP